MTYEVYIAGNLIELTDNKLIGLTIQVGNIFNLEGRVGNFTNTFKVPKTLVNQIALGNLSNINSDTNLPYLKNSAKIIQNGIEIVPDGFALIKETGESYSINVYSGNVSFFDRIKDKMISDLNWTDNDHNFNSGNILASWLGSSNYIYPIIDWSKNINLPLLNNTTSLNLDALLPLVFVKECMDRILTFSGYELKGTFKDSDVYPRLLMSPTDWGVTEAEEKESNGYAGDCTYEYNPYPTILIESSLSASGASETHDIPIMYNTFSKPTFTQGSPPIVTYVPETMIYGRLTFSLRIYLSISPQPPSGTLTKVTMNIFKDGNLIEFLDVIDHPSTLVNGYFTKELTTPTAILYPTSDYTATLVFECERHATIDYTITYSFVVSTFSVTRQRYVPYGMDIKFGRNFKVKMSDLIKDICNMYCLVVQVNDLTKQIFLNRLDEIKSNRTIDWSDKVDMSKRPVIKYQIPNTAQRNYFKYAEVEEVAIEVGKSYIDIADENLIVEKDLITLSAAASTSGLRLNNEHTPTVPLQDVIWQYIDQKKQRYFLLNKKDNETQWTISSEDDNGSVSTDVPFCYFSIDGVVDSLDFEHLISENYQAITGIFDQSKVVSLPIRLNEIDILNLDFTIPIHLDILNVNGDFYINKVSNFKTDASTMVELIRL